MATPMSGAQALVRSLEAVGADVVLARAERAGRARSWLALDDRPRAGSRPEVRSTFRRRRGEEAAMTDDDGTRRAHDAVQESLDRRD